jgi:uncharacterized protein YndB with AHSA1/START domain
MDSVKVRRTIAASPDRIWQALTDAGALKRCFFGADVRTDWQIGHPITFRGSYQGNPYEDHGVLKAFEPCRTLSFTHWSPLSGKPDTPEHRHTVTIRLEARGSATQVTLVQENLDGASAEHLRKNWSAVLEGLSSVTESESHDASPPPAAG